MPRKLIDFFHDQDGAVTVDFVALTAAICLIGAAVVLAFSPGLTGLANEVEEKLENQAVDFAADAALY